MRFLLFANIVVSIAEVEGLVRAFWIMTKHTWSLAGDVSFLQKVYKRETSPLARKEDLPMISVKNTRIHKVFSKKNCSFP